MTMKINYLIIILTAFIFFGKSSGIHAQDEDPYKDILFMIIDGDYEKAVSKAEKYNERDKTKREPVPYIYASMAYFEMSKKEEFQEDYPRAFRDAIKKAYKAKRYDKENEYMPQHSNYINELKAEVMREARFQYQSEKWRKSITYSKYVNRIDPDDISALLLKGVAEVKGRNTYQAKTTFEEAEEALKSFNASDISLEGKDSYLYAILEYAKLMEEEGTKEKAQPYLDAVAGLFEGDAEFQNFAEGY